MPIAAPELAAASIVDSFSEGYECWNRGDLDAMMDMYEPDAHVDASATFIDQSSVSGKDAIRQGFDEWLDLWTGLSLDPQYVYDFGNGRFLVDVAFVTKGARNGILVAQRLAFHYKISERGLIAKLTL